MAQGTRQDEARLTLGRASLFQSMNFPTLTSTDVIGDHPANSPVQRGFQKNNLIRDAK
jgi:hypothetical protein